MHTKKIRNGIHGEKRNCCIVALFENMNYTPIIGLEIHVELATESKMFCGCKNDPFFAPKPNIYTCPVCLAMPGGLPVPNRKAIEWTIKMGLALSCEIASFSKFDRKHYFYPDLPKGYQISQYDIPLAIHGSLKIPAKQDLASRDKNEEEKTIRINRVHLEEDTGKLQHVTVEGKRMTLVDFNRSGVPLMEIVTEPDFHDVTEVDYFVKKLQRIIRYLGISNADMEKGTMRIEPSISLRTSTSHELPAYRVELKNINSFRFVRRAIEYEITRQKDILNKGEKPVQQTRGYSEVKNVTIPQREKEEAHDYRYFPEPDIPPMHFTKTYIESIQKTMPELPDQTKESFQAYRLSDQDVSMLTESKDLANYFIGTATLATSDPIFQTITPKQIANVLINKRIDYKKISPRDLLDSMVHQKQTNDIDMPILTKTIKSIVEANSKAVEDYKKGKTTVLMFLVGQVKRALKGKGDAKIIKEELIKKLT
jgi:aspartyl-tRNA(Asn)/glutamyl-tRNA(Gln) amidotransferase subunit B